MKKKIIYNLLLTVGILVAIVLGKKTYDDKNYYLMATCILAVFFFIWKKIELTKEMRAKIKDEENKRKLDQ